MRITESRIFQPLALVAVSILVLAWLQAPRLADPYQVDGDFRSFYWMQKFQDLELYPDDQLAPELYQSVHLPWGEVIIQPLSPAYGLLFYAASFFITPVLFSKLLPFVLLPVTMLYLYAYGKSLRDKRTGVMLALGFMFLNLASSTSFTVLSGLQRAFTFPLIIILIYYLHRRQFKGAALVTVLAALIYAPIFVMQGAIWGVYFLRLARSNRSFQVLNTAGFGWLAAAAVVGILVMAPGVVPRFMGELGLAPQSQIGSVTESASQPIPVMQNPNYLDKGAFQMFYVFPFVGRGGIVEDSEEVVNLALLVALTGLIALVRRRKTFDLPPEINDALWAGLGMFILAWIAILTTHAFLLYVPNRYIRSGLFLYLLVLVVWNSREALAEAIPAVRNKNGLGIFAGGLTALSLGVVLFVPSDWTRVQGFNVKLALIPAVLVLLGLTVMALRRKSPPPALHRADFSRMPGVRLMNAALAVVLLLGWAGYARLAGGDGLIDPEEDERALLAFVSTLPKDALLAGTPRALDNIPLMAQRQVVFSIDLISNSPAPIAEALLAYYAAERAEVFAFCTKYGVDYFVVDETYYSPQALASGGVYYEPYNSAVWPRIEGRTRFALPETPVEARAFQSGPLFVASCAAYQP